jgi:hypothetical protein
MGTEIITTTKPTMRLLSSAATAGSSLNNGAEPLEREALPGVTWGMLLVLKATTAMNSSGKKR